MFNSDTVVVAHSIAHTCQESYQLIGQSYMPHMIGSEGGVHECRAYVWGMSIQV